MAYVTDCTCYDCGKVCEGDGNCARVCSLCKQKHINQHVGGALTCEPCIGCGHTSPSNHKGNPDCMNECTYCGEKDYSKHVVNLENLPCEKQCVCGFVNGKKHGKSSLATSQDRCPCGMYRGPHPQEKGVTEGKTEGVTEGAEGVTEGVRQKGSTEGVTH